MTAANPTFPDGNQREIIFKVFSTGDAPSLKVAGAGELKMLWGLCKSRKRFVTSRLKSMSSKISASFGPTGYSATMAA
jgi:hypothetical protein